MTMFLFQLGTPYQTNLDKEPVQPISSDYVSSLSIDFWKYLVAK